MTQSTSRAHKFESLQALRAIAAIMVVLFHMHVYTVPVLLGDPRRLHVVFGMGYAGVEIFFVLSGFIMVLVHRHQFGQPRHAVPFLLRRIERIYPLLWMVLGAVIVLQYLHDGGRPSVNEAIRAFTLWPTAGVPVLRPAWSLTFEMLFYIVFSLLIINLRVGGILAGAWFAACFVSAVTGYEGWGATLLLAPYNVLFLFGAVAATCFRRLGPALAWAALAGGVAVFLLVGLGLVYEFTGLDQGLRTLGYGVGATGIIAGLAALDLAGRIRTPRILVTLGDASYAIYLVHGIAMTMMAGLLVQLRSATGVGTPVLALALLIGALIAGTIAQFLLERPVLNWLRARRLPSA